MNADDEGPEEGEIEDDEDDVILIEDDSAYGSSKNNVGLEAQGSTKSSRKDSYERDIRNFESFKARAGRSGRMPGSSKSTYSKGSSSHVDNSCSRTKSKHSRTGLTHGKENRHVHRYKSPSHHHRNGSHDRTLADFKDISPFRRDSSCSSVESLDHREKSTMERSSHTHHRSTHKGSTRFAKSKRKSSSSPDSAHIAPKRISHSSDACPLMKVLRSVARETRLINSSMDNSENGPESSSLKQRLLNMGVMTESESSSSVKGEVESTVNVSCVVLDDNERNSGNLKENEKTCDIKQCEGTQTDEVCEEPSKQTQSSVVLSTLGRVNDTEELDVEELPHSSISTREKLDPIPDDTLLKSGSIMKLNSLPSPSIEPLGSDKDDDDDDISRLRLLALQSKKHEPTPVDDAEVLELRLAALKTAFMKKFKTRKKQPVLSDTNPSKEDPLLPIDDIPLPFLPGSPEEAMTPVDMELADTDDDAGSEHSAAFYSPSDPIHDCFPSEPMSVHCSSFCPPAEPYSPSRPTGSPNRELSLKELLPPPPPPDLVLYLSDPNPGSPAQYINTDHPLSGSYTDQLACSDVIEPPPLPPFFQDLLADTSDFPNYSPQNETNPSYFGNKDVESDYRTVNESSHISETPEASTADCDIAPLKLSISGVVESHESAQEANKNFHTAIGSTYEKPCPASTCEPERDVALSKQEEIILESSPNPTVSIINEPRSFTSLDEEEKLLRQRLLLNIANKRNKSLNGNQTKELSSLNNKEPQLAQVKIPPTKTKVFTNDTKKKVILNENKSNSKASVLSEPSTLKSKLPAQIVTVPPNGDNRLIINLDEDSDSNGDYSEAEALGHKCAKNRGKWLLHLKELEKISAKPILSGKKTLPIGTAKAPVSSSVKGKQPVKAGSMQKPFAENLADLENRVDKFLKGVRNSHEPMAKTPQGSSPPLNATPVAVRHLPPSQLEEYRRLKQQIARLERQRQTSVQLPKKNQLPVSSGTQRKIPAVSDKSGKEIMGSGQPTVSIVSTTLTVNNSKSIVDSVKPYKRLEIKDQKVPFASITQGPPVSTKKPMATTSLTAIDRHSNEKGPVKNVNQSISTFSETKVLQNVSSLMVPYTKKIDSVGLKAIGNEDNGIQQNQQSLLNLEATVIKGRSNVLYQLSALQKLLSQVEKSLIAQSSTASEVSTLMNKLYLAAGRWKAQEKTVAGLVQRVAQQQKELSLKHQNCINASKSCVNLGKKLKGAPYRIPPDGADVMRMQLKQVHEKTQGLAIRRSDERAKICILEKRAGDCLTKLFSDSRGVNFVAQNNSNLSVQPIVSLPSNTSKQVADPVPSTCQDTSQHAPQKSPSPASSMNLKQPYNSAPSLKETGGAPIPYSSSKLKKAMISRALSNRMALNKVRSAKAVLNFASKKRASKKEMRVLPKRPSKDKKMADQDFRNDPSDMEISTGDEEGDGRGKESCGNEDIMDISVSPDTSLSPPEKEVPNYPLNNAGVTCVSNGLQTVKVVEESSPPPVLGIAPFQEELVVSKKPEMKFSSRGVLKDYVSPLGGVRVFSSSTNTETETGDLNAILCPYDLNGKCQDSDCLFKHQNQ